MRNKIRLVVKGYAQEERIDFDEIFAPVTKLESIRMFLAFVCFKNFKLFQMDVNIFDESNDDIFKSCCEDNDVAVQEGFKKLTICDQDNAPLEEN